MNAWGYRPDSGQHGLHILWEKRVRNLLIALLACTLFDFGAAHARNPVTLVDIENEPIAAGSGKSLTLEEVGSALRQAGRIQGWSIDVVAPGTAMGTLVVRNKHTIKVDIRFTDKALSIKYKDSINMKYGTNSDGQPVIHPYYMTWIQNLLQDLRIELGRL